MTGTMTAEFGSAPSGPPLQSMGASARSVWLVPRLDARDGRGYWITWPERYVAGGGHTDVFGFPLVDTRSRLRRLVDRILRRPPPPLWPTEPLGWRSPQWQNVWMTTGDNPITRNVK